LSAVFVLLIVETVFIFGLFVCFLVFCPSHGAVSLAGISRSWSNSLHYRSFWVDSSSFISNISNISFIAISLVVHMLDTSIRKGNRVRSFSIAITITGLGSIESSLGVVISNSVGVSVRRRLIGVSRLSMDNRSMVGWSSVDYGGSMDYRGSMDYGGMVNNWGSMNSMNNWGSVNDWSMVYERSMNSMSDTMMSNRNDGSMSNSNRPVSTNSRLDLRETLSIIYLRNRGMGSSKSF